MEFCVFKMKAEYSAVKDFSGDNLLVQTGKLNNKILTAKN